jgi:hypothetical protein
MFQLRALLAKLDTRFFEWMVSLPTFTLGMLVLLWPATAHGSIFLVSRHVLTGLGLGDLASSLAIGCCLTAVGSFALTALVVNGKAPLRGARIRGCAAVWRSAFFVSIVLSMLVVSLSQPHISPMVLWFSFMAAGECWVALRAGREIAGVRELQDAMSAKEGENASSGYHQPGLSGL